MSPSSPDSDQLADRVDRRAVEERVAGHQHEARLLARASISSSASPDDAASGFSTKTCLPASSAAQRELVVRRDRRRDRDGLDRPDRARTSSSDVVAPNGRVAARRRLRGAPRRRSQTATSSASRQLVEVAHEVRAPVAEPDDRDAARDAGGRPVRHRCVLPSRCRRHAVPSCVAGAGAASGRAGGGRGRATSRARTRRPCRAPRRRSDVARAVTCHRPVMPGRHEEPLEVVRLEVLGLVGDARPRADERHVAAEHVEQLRQLVEARLAQPAADARDASSRSSL